MPRPSKKDHSSDPIAHGRSKSTKEWNGNTEGLRAIAHGSAGIVFALDEQRVVKVYIEGAEASFKDLEIERQAYRNIKANGGSKQCPHVLACYEIDNTYGLVLERCRTTVRRRLRSRGGGFSASEAVRLARQAAKGLAFVHSCGIVQGDVGCHNMLLGNDDNLKIADFAGSLVTNCAYPASVDYEGGSNMSGEVELSVRTDVFALGSAIYEMMTGKLPYKGTSYTEIQKLFRQGRFPQNFEAVPILQPIVEGCWGIPGVAPFANCDQVLSSFQTLRFDDTASTIKSVSFDLKKVQKPLESRSPTSLSGSTLIGLNPQSYVIPHGKQRKTRDPRLYKEIERKTLSKSQSATKGERLHKKETVWRQLFGVFHISYSGHLRDISRKQR